MEWPECKLLEHWSAHMDGDNQSGLALKTFREGVFVLKLTVSQAHFSSGWSSRSWSLKSEGNILWFNKVYLNKTSQNREVQFTEAVAVVSEFHSVLPRRLPGAKPPGVVQDRHRIPKSNHPRTLLRRLFKTHQKNCHGTSCLVKNGFDGRLRKYVDEKRTLNFFYPHQTQFAG